MGSPLALPAAHTAGARDPQDGPHADLRIRIHDEGVRVNLILNLAFTDEMVDVPRESADRLYTIEQELLREALEEHLAEALGVTVDEQRIEPDFVEYEVPEPDVELLPLFPRTGMRALLRVRFAIDYASPRAPRIVTLRWSDYPLDPILATPTETPTLVVSALVSGYGRDSLVRFTEEEPEYTWRATGRSLEDLFRDVPPPPATSGLDLPVPAIALGAIYLVYLTVGAFRGKPGRALALLPLALGGGALLWGVGRVQVAAQVSLREGEACSALKPLIANIYRAFDYDEEGDVYDALARSVQGDLLDTLYGRIQESLVYQEAGGAVARVRNVDTIACVLEESFVDGGAPAFVADATWQVEGGVYHWGHTHSRLNQYQARYTVRALEGDWRIVGEEVLAAERLDAAPEGFEDMPDAFDDFEDEWIPPDREF